MATGTDKILEAIDKSSEAIHSRLDDHELRLRAVETAITVQGLKVGAIIVLIVTVAGSIGSLIINKVDAIARWWAAQ